MISDGRGNRSSRSLALKAVHILRGQLDLGRGPFYASEAGSESLLWPHLARRVRYGCGPPVRTARTTDAGLLGSASQPGWAGACRYTSINSLGSALADRDRWPYVIPMLLGIWAVCCRCDVVSTPAGHGCP